METLSIVSGLLLIIGFVPYILPAFGRSLLGTRIEPKIPSRTTWLIWSLLDLVLLTGMYFKHALGGLIVAATLCAIGVAVLAFVKSGTSGWNRWDKITFVGTLAAIVVWVWSRDATVGIVIASAVLAVGALPLLAQVWREPTREDLVAWIIWFISGFLASIASAPPELERSLQPTVFFLVAFLVLLTMSLSAMGWRELFKMDTELQKCRRWNNDVE